MLQREYCYRMHKHSGAGVVSKGKEPEDEQGTVRVQDIRTEQGTRQGYAKRRKNEDDGNIKRRTAAGQDDAK